MWHLCSCFFYLHMNAEPQTANSSPAPHYSLLCVLSERVLSFPVPGSGISAPLNFKNQLVLSVGLSWNIWGSAICRTSVLSMSSIKILPAMGSLEILLSSCPWLWQILARHRRTEEDSSGPVLLSHLPGTICLTLPVVSSLVQCLSTSYSCSHGMTLDYLVSEALGMVFLLIASRCSCKTQLKPFSCTHIDGYTSRLIPLPTSPFPLLYGIVLWRWEASQSATSKTSENGFRHFFLEKKSP